jgi:hypothetical protein
VHPTEVIWVVVYRTGSGLSVGKRVPAPGVHPPSAFLKTALAQLVRLAPSVCLDLDPISRVAGLVRGSPALRHDALKLHALGLGEQPVAIVEDLDQVQA